VVRIPRGHFVERVFDLAGAASPRTVHDGGEHGDPSRPVGIKVRGWRIRETLLNCHVVDGRLDAEREIPAGRREARVFSSIPSAKRPTASNTYPAMVLARGASDLSIASEEARSRNLVIPSGRACRPGQWPCGGIHPKTRRVCACRAGGCC